MSYHCYPHSSMCSGLSNPGCRFQEVEEGKHGIDQGDFWFGYREVVGGRTASAAWHVEDVVDIFPVYLQAKSTIS